jgi:hypothetical protein
VKDQLLEIDVRLLLLRHGRQRVLDVLARLTDQTLEELEQQLRVSENKPKARKTKVSKAALVDIVASEYSERPDIAEPLRAIASNFENRTFLPELRDVERLFDRIGVSAGRLKSRAEAGPILIRALAKLSREELVKLATRDKVPGESEYSLLARAIMGAPTAKPSDKG